MVNADSKVGKLINGRYRILSALGTGASSHVYLAEDTQFGRMVALKMLVPDANSLQLNSRAFETEVAAITALSHEHNDHIVEIYDASLRTGEKYIVMEYVKGVTLREYMDDHRNMKLDDVYNCAEQILSALCLAHRVGIVHRDIKPQNVIVTEQGQLKVTDFGIAKLAKEDHFQLKNRTVGTVHYISPEQARGEETDARSDIYSLGVLLYELTTGRLPFDGQTVEVIAEKQITDNPVPPRQYRSNLPAGLEQVILCAMEKDQSDRFQSAEAMLAAISKVRKNPGVVFPGTPAEGEDPATAQPAKINPLAGVTNLLKAPVEAFSGMLNKRNRKQRNILIAAVAGAGALVVALAVILIVTLGGRGSNPDYVVVPDYINIGDMYGEDLYLRLGEAGLRLEEVKFVYDDAPAGTILERIMPGISEVDGKPTLAYGAPIYLTVSCGPDPGPEFINVTQFAGYFPHAKANLESYVRDAYGKCELKYEITSVVGAKDALGNPVKDGTVLSFSNKDGSKTVTADSTVLVEVASKEHEKLLAKSYVEILAELWTEFGVTATEKLVPAPNGETGTARILITRTDGNVVTKVVVETYN